MTILESTREHVLNEFVFDGVLRKLSFSVPRLRVTLIKVHFQGLVDIKHLTLWLITWKEDRVDLPLAEVPVVENVGIIWFLWANDKWVLSERMDWLMILRPRPADLFMSLIDLGIEFFRYCLIRLLSINKLFHCSEELRNTSESTN